MAADLLEYELFSEHELVQKFIPKRARSEGFGILSYFPTGRGAQLLAELQKYEDLAAVGKNSLNAQEQSLRAISLILIDRFPLARTDETSPNHDTEGSAKP